MHTQPKSMHLLVNLHVLWLHVLRAWLVLTVALTQQAGPPNSYNKSINIITINTDKFRSGNWKGRLFSAKRHRVQKSVMDIFKVSHLTLQCCLLWEGNSPQHPPPPTKKTPTNQPKKKMQYEKSYPSPPWTGSLISRRKSAWCSWISLTSWGFCFPNSWSMGCKMMIVKRMFHWRNIYQMEENEPAIIEDLPAP